jgi:hypothetical protein
MSTVLLLGVAVVVAVLLGLFPNMDAMAKRVLIVILVVALLAWILTIFGLFDRPRTRVLDTYLTHPPEAKHHPLAGDLPKTY